MPFCDKVSLDFCSLGSVVAGHRTVTTRTGLRPLPGYQRLSFESQAQEQLKWRFRDQPDIREPVSPDKPSCQSHSTGTRCAALAKM